MGLPAPVRAVAKAPPVQPPADMRYTSFSHKAEWAAFTRASTNSARVSQEWADAYRRGGKERAELFRQYVLANGDIDCVEMDMKRARVCNAESLVCAAWESYCLAVCATMGNTPRP